MILKISLSKAKQSVIMVCLDSPSSLNSTHHHYESLILGNDLLTHQCRDVNALMCYVELNLNIYNRNNIGKYCRMLKNLFLNCFEMKSQFQLYRPSSDKRKAAKTNKK